MRAVVLRVSFVLWKTSLVNHGLLFALTVLELVVTWLPRPPDVSLGILESGRLGWLRDSPAGSQLLCAHWLCFWIFRPMIKIYEKYFFDTAIVLFDTATSPTP